MRASIPVRVASVLIFVHAVMHTAGGVFGKVDAGPSAKAVAAMQTYRHRYFFAAPAVTEVMIAPCLLVAMVSPRSEAVDAERTEFFITKEMQSRTLVGPSG